MWYVSRSESFQKSVCVSVFQLDGGTAQFREAKRSSVYPVCVCVCVSLTDESDAIINVRRSLRALIPPAATRE